VDRLRCRSDSDYLLVRSVVHDWCVEN
jgi:hypothetical protein